MHVCTSLQTDNHASTPPLCFLQAGCPSCRPTNSVKALKAKLEDSVDAKFYCPHALADGTQCIRIRDKTLQFSSTVLSTLSLYFMVSADKVSK